MKAKYQTGPLQTKNISIQDIVNMLTQNVDTFKLEKLSLVRPITPREDPIDIIAMYGNALQRNCLIAFLVTLSLIRAH